MQKDNRQAHLRYRLTFVKEATGQGCDFLPWPSLVRNFYVHAILCGYFQSPELVRINMWPLFCPQGRNTEGRFIKVRGGLAGQILLETTANCCIESLFGLKFYIF